MDSVIAKLDTSVFGMLTDQEPRIMIDGVSTPEEIELVNRLKPDFIRFDREPKIDSELKTESNPKTDQKEPSYIAAPGIRILTSVDDIPLYSSALDKRTLSLDTKTDASDLPAMIKNERPDILIIKLDSHDDEALASLEKLVHSARSAHQDFVD